MPNLAKSQEDILREALREILDRTNKEKARDPHAAIAGGILEIHDIANTALAEFDRTQNAPANTSAMQAALEDMLEKIDAWRTDGTMEHWQYSQLFNICDAALAAPARNCDVGTEAEQQKRFEEFCHKTDCGECPAFGSLSCGVSWGNAPFAPDEKGKEVDHG